MTFYFKNVVTQHKKNIYHKSTDFIKIVKNSKKEVYVFLGVQDGNDIENTGRAHQVLEILYHPMFIESKYSADKTIGHDIAAVKIKSTNLIPICLPTLGRGKFFYIDLLKNARPMVPFNEKSMSHHFAISHQMTDCRNTEN